MKMYIEKTNDGRYNLMDMTRSEVMQLFTMIGGASLQERRTFHHIGKDITVVY